MKKTLYLTIALLCFFSLSYADMSIDFIDVGQGDAIFVVLPSSKTVLIDGGATPLSVESYLIREKVATIDYLVLTHPHSDHYGGLGVVFDKQQVNNFYDTGVDNLNATGDEGLRFKATHELGCVISTTIAGQQLNWDPEVSVTVLNAGSQTLKTRNGYQLNDASIVLKMTYQGRSVLLTGDIGKDVEDKLVRTYGDTLRSDILKVAHHGSQYSTGSTFIDTVKPHYAVIEVGSNSYGHPAKNTLDTLDQSAIPIYRTDIMGEIQFVITSSGAIIAPQVVESSQSTTRNASK